MASEDVVDDYGRLLHDRRLSNYLNHEDYVAIAVEVSSILRGGMLSLPHLKHHTVVRHVVKSTGKHNKTK